MFYVLDKGFVHRI